MSALKIIALLLSALVVGITITNAVYFNRLYRSIKNTRAGIRDSLYGSNALTTSLAMWWLNIILAVLSSLFFIFVLFKMGTSFMTDASTSNSITIPPPEYSA